MDIRFNHPASHLVVGASRSGKSTLVHNLLIYKKLLFKHQPRKVILIYKRDQEIYNSMKKQNLVDIFIDFDSSDIEKVREIMKEYKSKDENGHIGSIVILDDLLNDLSNGFQTMFSVDSHHFNSSIIMISQKLHYQSEIYRTIALNCEYTYIMKNPRNSSIRHLAQQISPFDVGFPLQSYLRATKKPFSYILYDATQDSPDIIRLRSHIFPYQWPVRVYIKT